MPNDSSEDPDDRGWRQGQGEEAQETQGVFAETQGQLIERAYERLGQGQPSESRSEVDDESGSSDAFDEEFGRLKKRSGLIRTLVDWIGAMGTASSWKELERLPEKRLENTDYWTTNAKARSELSTRWATLGNQRGGRPTPNYRYELTEFFGSVARAKVFFDWMRTITGGGSSQSLRWQLCDHCGDDLVYDALVLGVHPCPNCGKPNDLTIYGNEQVVLHTPWVIQETINGRFGWGDRNKRSRPNASITRPE